MPEKPITSLAESLGLADPIGTPEPEAFDTLPESMTGKQFAQAVLTSVAFRRYLVNGLTMGDLPAAVLCRLMDHGWGKPVERLEVRDSTVNPEDLSLEELEARLEQRQSRVQQMLRLLRTQTVGTPTNEAVH